MLSRKRLLNAITRVMDLIIYSVSELTRHIKNLLETDPRLSSLWVRGEISNFKRHYSGHCYFTLKDGGAGIRSVMFKSRAQYLKFAPSDGLKVVVFGRISLYERDGQYQLYADQIVPEGVGELSLAFQQLKERLAGEGLFDEERKQPLPVLPRSVGVVTSPAGAALRDIFTVSKRRCPNLSLVLFPVAVQGTEAPEQIAHAIEVFNRMRKVDVLIVGRGGGSIEELWAFNDERVVRAIAASRIPVVSAVGHQTDYTLADFAADRRAATPSQAAEIVAPDVFELGRYIRTLRRAMEQHLLAGIKRRRMQLEQLQRSHAFQRPLDLLAAKQQEVDMLSQHLERQIRQLLLKRQHAFHVCAEKLSMLSPLAVLARGYSILETPDGHVVSQAADAVVGDRLEVVMHTGAIDVEVLEVREEKRF